MAHHIFSSACKAQLSKRWKIAVLVYVGIIIIPSLRSTFEWFGNILHFLSVSETRLLDVVGSCHRFQVVNEFPCFLNFCVLSLVEVLSWIVGSLVRGQNTPRDSKP